MNSRDSSFSSFSKSYDRPLYDSEKKIYINQDGIQIVTIHVKNLPSKIKREQLRNYFKNFGSIRSVSVLRAGKRCTPYIYGFITFENAQAAARALKEKQHCVNKKRIKVKPADSWNQARNLKRNKAIENLDFSNSIPILRLNDDCFFHILSSLSLLDLLSFSKACERFNDVANVVFSRRKELDVESLGEASLMTVREILAKIGLGLEKLICHIHGRFPATRFVEIIPKYSKRLKNLELINVKGVQHGIYKKMFRTLKFLTTLKLQDCFITDDICALLEICENLEHLNLSENYEITGKYLQKLINLKILNLRYCLNLQPVHFNELMSKVKLESLNIEHCDSLDSSSMELLLRHQTELIKLSISNSYKTSNLSPVAKLKSLKCLEVRCGNDVDDMFFEDLALHNTGLEKLEISGTQLNATRKQALANLKNLKELCIPRSEDIDDGFIYQIVSRTPLTYLCCAGCDNISTNGILNLIRKSSTIEKIDISSCDQFYDELIFNAIDILKEKQRVTRLTFVIGNTSISEFIQTDPKIVENSHLINLKFESTHLFFDFEYTTGADHFDLNGFLAI